MTILSFEIIIFQTYDFGKESIIVLNKRTHTVGIKGENMRRREKKRDSKRTRETLK
jgi:hypothetical protein